MSDNYFKPVDFSSFNQKEAPVVKTVSRDPEKEKATAEAVHWAIQQIHEELNRISVGQSKMVSHAVQISDKIPFVLNLKQFKALPTKEKGNSLVTLARQDFSELFAQFVKATINKLFETPNDQ